MFGKKYSTMVLVDMPRRKQWLVMPRTANTSRVIIHIRSNPAARSLMGRLRTVANFQT